MKARAKATTVDQDKPSDTRAEIPQTSTEPVHEAPPRAPVDHASADSGWQPALSVAVPDWRRSFAVRIQPPPIRHHGTGPGRRPRVSVVVTAHNSAETLVQALSSIQRQDFEEWECVVVDDASTDQVLGVATRFAQRDRRFTVLRHHERRGPSAARNAGIAAATADFVAFLDGDDVLFPKALSSRLRVAARDLDLTGAYCDWISFWGRRPPSPPDREARQLGRVSALTAAWDCPFVVSAPLVRRQILVDVGGFDESLHTAEDMELWLRVLRAGHVLGYAGYIGVAYRQLESGIVRRTSAEHVLRTLRLTEELEEPLRDPVLLAGPRPVRRPLSEYLRETAFVERALRFLVLALAAGDEDGAREVAAAIDPLILDLHADGALVAHTVQAGIARLGWTNPRFVVDAEELRAKALALVAGSAQRPAGAVTLPPLTDDRSSRDLRSRDVSRDATAVHAAVLEIPAGQDDPAAEGAALLLIENLGHVAELGPVVAELVARGQTVAVMVGEPGPVTADMRAALAPWVGTVYRFDAGLPDRVRLGAVVGFLGYPALEEISARVGASGLRVLALVDDRVHRMGLVPSSTLPQLTAHSVLVRNEDEARRLASREVRVYLTGSVRWERARALAADRRPGAVAVVHVGWDADRDWVATVAMACIAAGGQWSVVPDVRLPDDDLLSGEAASHLASAPLSHLLLTARALVALPGDAVGEALTMGVPVICYVPGGFPEAKSEPGVAVARTPAELTSLLAGDPALDLTLAMATPASDGRPPAVEPASAMAEAIAAAMRH